VRVYSGAELRCSMGTETSTFTASHPAGGVWIDKEPFANIGAFSRCWGRLDEFAAEPTPGNCLPFIGPPWTPAADGSTINGERAIDTDSTCFCTYGGLISVLSSGSATEASGQASLDSGSGGSPSPTTTSPSPSVAPT
jgi:hypothetical protein